jgi:hypothetical protein
MPADLVEIKKRREHVKKLIVSHPRYTTQIMDKIEEVHYFSVDSVECDSLFLYGETGVGKSSILEEYRDRFPRKIIKGYTIVPVLYNKVPVGATPKSVASSLLNSLGDPSYDKGTETNQTERLLHFIKKCKVELIIIDEFQHLIDRETKHVLNKASEWIKKFCDDAGVPIILCGMPESIKIIEHNEQLDRRFLDKLSMLSFSYTSKEEQVEFRGFLNNIDEQLPFYKKSFLAERKLSEKIYYATKGVPFYINKLLREATTLAAKNGNDSIDENHLYSAFRLMKFSKRPHVTNPFTDEKFNIIGHLIWKRERVKIKKLAKSNQWNIKINI